MILKSDYAGINKFWRKTNHQVFVQRKLLYRSISSTCQNLTYVRETTTLIHSNAVDVIDQDLHLILQGWETSTPPKWQQQQQKQGWANARGKKIRMDGEMVDQWRDEETDGCRQYGCEE